ncbi:tRNA lysidine(34) synthetase TilS [Altericroceibacterium endophyticum]|uniref:tRNA(Ile)-lysidine synthase n=1 Tax=Altericroceibacterium endophyticum TaxID=1808508 RepID=A0A6I4T8M3_9SPHN|nr:tRNA lysidine(34) synthetase TilS [Altericroceibacterium endophyticum]MXO66612.1 tRNA lysidine(34) synthetase TilS [Altericroceibacterium endophyticum]
MNATDPASNANDGFPHRLIARFAGDLAKLWPEGSRLGLAVSGGPDSLALLLLAEAVLPGRVEVATVDHGLRPEATGECSMVKELCAGHGIPCEMLKVEVQSGNLQDRARAARYAVMGQWMKRRGLGALATAHHADDQAETLLMRLNRGSGVAGLAGVRARGVVPGTKLTLLRPVLGWRRSELREVIDLAGLSPALDPSNEDERFDRVKMRKNLADADWINPVALAASAAHLTEAEQTIEWATTREWKERVTVSEGEIRYRPETPRLIVMRIVIRAIRMLGGDPRGGAAARLVARLRQGKDATLGGVVVRISGSEWVFRKEPARRVQGQ